MVSEHALPSAPKSADRIEGAMIAGGDILGGSVADRERVEAVKVVSGGANGCAEVCSGDC